MFARKELAIPTFGIRNKSVLENSGISNDNVHQTTISEIPPWTLHQPTKYLDLSNSFKKDAPSLVFIQTFNEIKYEHSYSIPIYTDGSKEELALQYYTKLLSCPSHLAFEYTINPKYQSFFARKHMLFKYLVTKYQ